MSCADSSTVSSETSRFLARSFRSSSRLAASRFLTFSPDSFLETFAVASADLGDMRFSSGSLGIRDAGERRGRPVDLLRQEQPCQLVGQGHPGKREDSTRPPGQRRVEAEGAPDRENDGRGPGIEPSTEVPGELGARELPPPLVAEDEEVAGLQDRKKALGLPLPDP